ncbi:MAG TPA: hypothetical protein PLW10_13055, partial [Myxococcota bacterium]|nr:hypothetical protein [Myxococcota bacterium]
MAEDAGAGTPRFEILTPGEGGFSPVGRPLVAPAADGGFLVCANTSADAPRCAALDASGTRGGGSIRVGGEQQGGGTLQRARSVVVDADSEIRADADRRGDGGRIIVFSEDLTIVDGDLSATGGRKGGDGGFIETSGLRNFAISSLPDVSARRGEAGGWLIDPYDITIRNAVPTDPLVVGDCSDLGDDVSCGNQLNAALLAILDPDFDPLAFDGILRTIEPGSDGYGGYTNVIDPDLLARALAIGTDVTLSTQAFGLDREADGLDDLGNPVGNITIEDAIVIDSDLARRGTAAKLVLLAAAGIRVDADIRVDPDSTADALRRVALDVELRANDLAQADPAADFSGVLVNGDVLIDADVVTGGGDFTASGIGIELASGRTIDTDGGAVLVASGSLDATGQVARIIQRDRRAADLATVVAGALAPDPHITIAGDIDTTRDPARRDGGNVTLNASSIDVQTSQTGDDPVEIVTGQLTLTGSVTSGGGDVILRGGIEVNADSTAVQSVFVGNVDVAGGSIDSGGGDVRIRANRVDPEADAGKLAPVFVDGTRNEGGDIKVQGTVTTSGGLLEIGDARTRSVSLDGTFDTTDATDPSENGLLRVLALDASDPEVTDLGEGGGLGEGRIAIGTLDAGPTELVSAGITITSRDVVTSSTGASNDVVIRLAGDSSATAAAVDAGTDPLATAGRLEITGDHRVALFERTTLAGETIAITTAAAPLSITDAEADDSTLPVPGKARLVLGGDAATGVLLAGDFVTIAIGDGTTPGTDGLAEETGTLAAPTDFGIARQTTALWNGLSLRDYDAGAALGVGSERPEELSIRQDGDLSIVATAPGASTTGQIALALVFGSATIGANGMLTTLESSDGILTIEDASALANDPTPGGGDDGLSRVVLRGGLFLPTDATTPPPGLARNPIVLANPTPFDVDSLTLSSPAELTIDDTMAAAFGTPRELVLEAGRNTAIDGADGRGTLTLGVGTGFTLHASERLALHAGGNGSGDLVFADPGLTLAADEIELRAGSGDPANAADPSEIVGLQSNGVELLDGSGVTELGADASTAVAFSFRQDASIDVQTALPDLDQLVDVPGASPLAGVTYSVRSDAGQIDLDDGVVGTNEAERFASADLELV